MRIRIAKYFSYDFKTFIYNADIIVYRAVNGLRSLDEVFCFTWSYTLQCLNLNKLYLL